MCDRRHIESDGLIAKKYFLVCPLGVSPYWTGTGSGNGTGRRPQSKQEMTDCCTAIVTEGKEVQDETAAPTKGTKRKDKDDGVTASACARNDVKHVAAAAAAAPSAKAAAVASTVSTGEVGGEKARTRTATTTTITSRQRSFSDEEQDEEENEKCDAETQKKGTGQKNRPEDNQQPQERQHQEPRHIHSIEVLAEEVDDLRRRLDRFRQEQDELLGQDTTTHRSHPRMRELPVPPPPLPNAALPGATAFGANAAASVTAVSAAAAYPCAAPIPLLSSYAASAGYLDATIDDRRRYHAELKYLEQRRAYLIGQNQSSSAAAAVSSTTTSYVPSPATAAPSSDPTQSTLVGQSQVTARSPSTSQTPLPPPSIYNILPTLPLDRLYQTLPIAGRPPVARPVGMLQSDMMGGTPLGLPHRDPLADSFLPPWIGVGSPGMATQFHLRHIPAPLPTAHAGYFPPYPATVGNRFGMHSTRADIAPPRIKDSGSLSLLSSVSAAAAAEAPSATDTAGDATSPTKLRSGLSNNSTSEAATALATDVYSPSRSPRLVQRGRVLTAASRGTSTDSEASISLLSLGGLSRCSAGSSGSLSEDQMLGILPTMKRKLSQHYQPSETTVILGKGNGPKVAPGNIRLKGIILDHVDEYSKGERREKIGIITEIIKDVRRVNTIAGFVKYEDSNGGSWWEVTERDARVKVTAMFRDCLHENYRSSSSNKVRRRQEKRQQNKSLVRKTNSSAEGECGGDDDDDDDKDVVEKDSP